MYPYFCTMICSKTIVSISLIFGIISPFCAQEKKDYSSYNFRSPIDIPLVLAGNFGEIRSNHFHTGIDIKTNRRTGYSIHAVEDGYISRIKIHPWGYGHALYITHPNGITSVYGHLKHFVGKIHDVALAQQKKKKGFSIDYYPPKGLLLVKKGQIIAKSGNTGSTAGPHLHFELRDTKTEHPLNPLLFHFPIKDTRPPLITRLKVYGLTQKGYRIPEKQKYYTVYHKEKHYYIQQHTVTIPASFTSKKGGIGFAFDTFDKLNGASNPCGTDQTSLIVDGDTVYSQDKSYLDFKVNRYVNSHTDYQDFHRHHYYYEKAFKTKDDPLPIYRKLINDGVIKVIPGHTYSIKFVAKDVYGNMSQLRFKLIVEKGTEVNQQHLYPGKKLLYPDSAFLSYNASHYIFFPPGLVYEPTPLIIHSSPNKIEFGNPKIPLQSTYKIMLPLPSTTYGQKYYIQRKNKRGWHYSEKGTIKKGWITARVKNFGTFSVQLDTVSPSIKRRNFRNNSVVHHRRLTWYISDKSSGISNFGILINGQWYLLQYEPKQRKYFFDPPQGLSGKQKLTVRATDNCGNTTKTSYTLTF